MRGYGEADELAAREDELRCGGDEGLVELRVRGVVHLGVEVWGGLEWVGSGGVAR